MYNVCTICLLILNVKAIISKVIELCIPDHNPRSSHHPRTIAHAIFVVLLIPTSRLV